MGQARSLICGDCLDWLRAQQDDSVDLIFGSPPYEDARTYGIDFRLRGQDWVDWMVARWREMNRVCRGLVAMVVEGKTKNFRWSATPALLMADLHRAGIALRKPPAFQRVGIPGSGGPDWLRNDYEFIVCSSRGKLPWSDNTAMGHPPKWAPGGEMSYRLTDGTRRNQWGHSGRGIGSRGKDGEFTGGSRPSHVMTTKRMVMTRPRDGIHDQTTPYSPPVKANPGNVIKCLVGGGLMGDPLAHENEAPFPESLVEFFVLSFCPPGGTVYDPFAGSGTTGAVALRYGRSFVGTDVRATQIDVCARRLQEVQLKME